MCGRVVRAHMHTYRLQASHSRFSKRLPRLHGNVIISWQRRWLYRGADNQWPFCWSDRSVNLQDLEMTVLFAFVDVVSVFVVVAILHSSQLFLTLCKKSSVYWTTLRARIQEEFKAKQHLHFPICPCSHHIHQHTYSWSLCIYFFFNFTITLPYISAHIIICHGSSPNDCIRFRPFCKSDKIKSNQITLKLTMTCKFCIN